MTNKLNPLDSKSPISFRPTEEERKTLEILSGQNGTSVSGVLRKAVQSLTPLVQLQSPGMPLYAKQVTDAEVDAAVEEATDAACDVLDTLMESLGSQSQESTGISSNFKGLLAEHLRAMLVGSEHARKSYSTPLKPLFANYKSFGTARSTGNSQGFTMVRDAAQVGAEPLYFSEGKWVELRSIDIGGLFTSQDYAIAGVLKAMEAKGETPSEHPMRIVVVDYSTDVNKVVE